MIWVTHGFLSNPVCSQTPEHRFSSLGIDNCNPPYVIRTTVLPAILGKVNVSCKKEKEGNQFCPALMSLCLLGTTALDNC